MIRKDAGGLFLAGLAAVNRDQTLTGIERVCVSAKVFVLDPDAFEDP